MSMKSFLKTAACAMLGLMLAVPAVQAEEKFPTKPIKMVMPFAPGGSTDIAARILAKYMTKYLGVEVPVVNVVGSAGFSGSLQVAEAKPDGYTILCQLPTLMTSYHTGVSRFTWDEYDPIARVQQFSTALAMRKDAPWQTTQELIEYVKANPGKVKWGLNFGAGLHFLALNFADASDTVGMWQYAQTGGDETSLKSMLGGHIDVAGTGDSVVLQHYKAGSVKVLGALSDERLATMPDVPTFKEQGIDSTFIYDIVMYAPKGTDENAMKVLREVYAKISKDPDYIAELAVQSLYPAFLDGPALINFLVDQDTMFYKFARLGNLIPERQ